MGDANPPADRSTYHPNECDHPWDAADDQTVTLSVGNDVLATYEFTVCQRCGNILDQPDKFDFNYLGDLTSEYDPE